MPLNSRCICSSLSHPHQRRKNSPQPHAIHNKFLSPATTTLGLLKVIAPATQLSTPPFDGRAVTLAGELSLFRWSLRPLCEGASGRGDGRTSRPPPGDTRDGGANRVKH